MIVVAYDLPEHSLNLGIEQVIFGSLECDKMAYREG